MAVTHTDLHVELMETGIKEKNLTAGGDNEAVIVSDAEAPNPSNTVPSITIQTDCR